MDGGLSVRARTGGVPDGSAERRGPGTLCASWYSPLFPFSFLPGGAPRASVEIQSDTKAAAEESHATDLLAPATVPAMGHQWVSAEIPGYRPDGRPFIREQRRRYCTRCPARS